MNCIKIGLPGKLILSKRKRSLGSPILLEIVSENQFSGKTYCYTIGSSSNGANASAATGAAMIPAVGHTQRATIDCERNEIHVMTVSERGGAIYYVQGPKII